MQGKSGQFISDLHESQEAILISFGMGFVYSLVFIYLMSAFAETIAWLCVFLIQIGLLGLTAGSFFGYHEYNQMAAKDGITA